MLGRRLRIGTGGDGLPSELIVIETRISRVVGESRAVGCGARGTERDRSLVLAFVLGGRRQVVKIAPDAGGGRLARFLGRSTSRKCPDPATIVVRADRTRISTSSAHTCVGFKSAIPQQVACVIQSRCKISVVNLLLYQAVLDGPMLFLELGDLGLELLILELQMAERGFELSRGRPAGKDALPPRATGNRHQAHQQEHARKTRTTARGEQSRSFPVHRRRGSMSA